MQPWTLKAIVFAEMFKDDCSWTVVFVNAQDSEKRTPLHAAAYLGDAEIIELLVLSGMKGQFYPKREPNLWYTDWKPHLLIHQYYDWWINLHYHSNVWGQ